MKGNKNVISILQKACRAELQAISQYRTHMHMQAGAGYSKIRKRLTREHMQDEERHLDAFMERLVDLEGTPDISEMPALKIGQTIPDQYEADLGGEYSAIELYREAVRTCEEEGDFKTAKLFRNILAEEEDHAGDFETQLSLIKDCGLENYLARHSHVEAK